jgi:hypothetical protein
VPGSDFSSGIHEGNSRSVGDLAARATKRKRDRLADVDARAGFHAVARPREEVG